MVIKKFSFLYKLVLASLVVCFLLLLFYVIQFNGGLSNEHERWGEFGSFIGGVISPVFSFFSLLAVLFIFEHEMKEKRKDDTDRKVFQLLDLLNRSYEIIYKYGYSGPGGVKESPPQELFWNQFESVKYAIQNYDKAKEQPEEKPEEKPKDDEFRRRHQFDNDYVRDVKTYISNYKNYNQFTGGHTRTIYETFRQINKFEERAYYFDLLQGQIPVDVIKIFIIEYYKNIIENSDLQAFLMNINKDVYDHSFLNAESFNNILEDERFKN